MPVWAEYRLKQNIVCQTDPEPVVCPEFCHSWVAYDPATGIFPFTDAESDPIAQVNMPWIGIESGEIVLPQGDYFTLGFSVYGDLPVQNLMLYAWEIKKVSTGELISDPWVYWGEQLSTDGAFRFETQQIPGIYAGETVQIQLRAYDGSHVWGDQIGYTGVHTSGPIFDNVAIYAANENPLDIVNDIPVACVTNNTESGDNVEVDVGDSGVNLVFDHVSGEGDTEVTITSTGPPPPTGFQLGNPATYYDLSTTAVFDGPVTICITYNVDDFRKPESLSLLHHVDNKWIDCTVSHDLVNRTICGEVESFSYFAIMQSTTGFTDVAAIANVADGSDGQGVAWGDYNNDGWADLLVANFGSPHRLYQNQGDGTFVDVASGPISEANWGCVAAASWGDYDNDGDLDIYFASVDCEGRESRLLRNDGGDVFVDATTPPAGENPGGFTGFWVDYDNDGYLDIFRDYSLLHNNGDGTFTDNKHCPLGVGANSAAFGDYNNDGNADVFIGRGCCGNYLYLNEGCGSFTNAPARADFAVPSPGGAFGCEWGDYDNDGDLDMYMIGFNSPNYLFENDGNGHFADVTVAPLNFNGPSQDYTWLDYDNDGDLDIFLMVRDAPNKLFRNDGGGVWVEDTRAPLNENGMRGTVATADYDNDGDIDIYVSGAWAVNKLYRNDLDNGNHWLHVNLVGTASNAAALGARVTVVAGGVTQIRELTGGDKSQNSLTAEFGLGAATSVDDVIVRWPSGIVQSLGPVGTVDQLITVTEAGTTPNIACEFERVIGGPEFSIASMPFGVAWGDYDNDGDEDMVSLSCISPDLSTLWIRLFNNDSSGSLTEATPTGLKAYPGGCAHSGTWIDYDNDGDLDFHHTVWWEADRLFENDGSGGLTDVASAIGIDSGSPAINAVWADFDSDGWVDCYIVNHGDNLLYRNDGGTFVNVTGDHPGLIAQGWEPDAAWADFDNDGDQDLFVGSEQGNYLFRNDAGVFINALDPSHILVTTTDNESSAWGDYDNDGYLDLAITGINGTSLFHNDGGMDFTAFAIAAETGVGADVSWVDYDNDGWLDLYVTRGGTNTTDIEFEPNALYHNNADGTFTDVARGAVLNYNGGAGAAWADFDNDGDQDVFMHSRYWSCARQVRNIVGTQNNWLQFKLVGKISNAAAIGARIIVDTGSLSMIREINGGSGNGGQNSLRAAFGLGDAATADVTILWPSGVTQSLADVAANQILTVEEPTIGNVAGHVTADCPEPDTGLYGVTVDAFEIGTGVLAGTALTDSVGDYMIDSLLAGDYSMTMVTPLGYFIDIEEQLATILFGDTVYVDFALTCLETSGDPRGIGFWKHQIGVALGGKGKAHIDGATLCEYLDMIEFHFNSNEINQVVVYEPPVSDECADKLGVAKELLNLKGKVEMVRRAKQHFMALLFNVSANYLSLRAEISEDGATLSQAVTFCDSLVTDGDTGNDERAKDIAEMINKSQVVPAGWIPLTTADIAYSPASDLPNKFGMAQNYPNPFNPTTKIQFDLASDGPVSLKVYDVAGRLVTTLVSRNMPRGRHLVSWDATTSTGNPVASGVYLVRMSAGSYQQTMRVVLLK